MGRTGGKGGGGSGTAGEAEAAGGAEVGLTACVVAGVLVVLGTGVGGGGPDGLVPVRSVIPSAGRAEVKEEV